MPGLPFPDVSFDGVAAGFVISHLASQVDGLREMVRICKSGGRVGVTTWGTLPTVTRRVHTGLSHRPRHQTMNLPTSVVLNLTSPFTATNRVGDRVIGLGMVFEAGRGLTAAVHASGISSRPGSRPLIHDVAWCPIPHDGWVRARSRRCSPIGNGSATSRRRLDVHADGVVVVRRDCRRVPGGRAADGTQRQLLPRRRLWPRTAPARPAGQALPVLFRV